MFTVVNSSRSEHGLGARDRWPRVGYRDYVTKNLSQTGGPEHYLVHGRPKQIPNLVGKTDHNVGGLAYILRLTNSHNQSP